MKNSLLTLCSLAVLTSMLNQPALAQDTSSAIRGKIINASGAPISNATILIEDTRTGSIRTLTSNSTGTFLASQLPVGGPYRVTVNDSRTVVVESIELGDIYSLSINMASQAAIEEMVVMGQSQGFADVAAGPAATFSSFDMDTAVAFERDIKDVYSIDPRINLDDPAYGSAVNCVGKHPRFNSITLDGVSQNDRFGLNDNGYSTATGMPFPYDAINQVAVELAPFDVTYGGFSACNINSVTRSGSNQWTGNVFYEWTSNDLRGDSLKTGSSTINIDSEAYDERQKGFSVGGPILRDQLFFYAAYEEAEEPRFIAQGYDGSGNGEQRDWLSEADYNRIADIAQNLYGYDAGEQPGNGAQTQEKTFFKLDWNINDRHSASIIYNSYEGAQDRASDSDSNEFEFSNHFYVKGSDVDSTTVMLRSQWTDALSTEVFYNQSEMIDSQETVGPKDFAEVQIRVDGNTVYLGADDSRQANSLSTDSTFFKLSGQFLLQDHVITAGYEQEKLDIFNLFVQHSRGGEIRFGSIDQFEAGTPDRYYYGSGGGSNDANDAAASFSNTQHSIYVQDEIVLYDYALTLTGGLRYDWFSSNDRPIRNQTFETANGIRNDANIDGLDILMPRLGFTWEATDKLSVRGGVGLYSGGNPNVWLSNAWSNDGITNVQVSNSSYDGTTESLFDGSIPLIGSERPGRDVPQDLYDTVASVNPAAGMGSDSRLVLIDPDYKQPGEWKYALGGTYYFDNGWSADADLLYSRSRDTAIYVDLSQEIVGQTAAGQPIYDFVTGADNLMLTNTDETASSLALSMVLKKDFDFGLDLTLGYAYTDAEDVNSMSSATADSNFDNVALLDINNPEAGRSNYETPHRFTLRASYGHEFFSGYETRFTTYLVRKSGQPQSYVMGGSNQFEGDGYYGRHLLYVPTGLTDPNAVFDPAFDSDAFFSWAEQRDLGSGFVKRNENYASWSTRMDLRIDQELPTFLGNSKGRLFFKVYNVLNMLNDEWGKQYDAEFYSIQVVNASVDDQGRYVYEDFNGGNITNLLESSSLWEARMGIEFKF